MQKTQVICDECGAEKKETNHWLKRMDTTNWFALSANESHQGGWKVVADYCGISCAIKALSKWAHEINPNFTPPTMARSAEPPMSDAVGALVRETQPQ
jgi:hypothetical protein